MFRRKKKKQITGKLLYPIQIGYRAMIDDGNSIIQTSVVQRIFLINTGRVKFETENTRYELHLKGERVNMAS